MDYLRKTVVSAAAAALVSAAVSMNRYRINHLMHTRRRYRLIRELARQYDVKLEEAYQHAEKGSVKFIERRYSDLFQMAKDQGMSDDDAAQSMHQLREWAKMTLYMELAIQVTRGYADQLHLLDSKRAAEIDVQIGEDLIDAKESYDRMRHEKFPVDELLRTLDIKGG